MNEALEVLSAAVHMGCLGQFNPCDRICRTRCALRLRCAMVNAEKQRLMMIDAYDDDDELFPA